MIRKGRMNDTPDLTHLDALFSGDLKVDDVVDCLGHWVLIWRKIGVELSKSVAGFQRLCNKLVFLGVKQMSYKTRMFAHDRRPEARRLAEADCNIAPRELRQPSGKTFGLAQRMVKERSPNETL